MDHAPGVGVGHRLADLLEDPQEPRAVGLGRRPVGQELGQGAALDQLHREVRPGVGESTQLVDRHDARVLELAGDLRLLDEPADQLGLVAVRLEQDLDGQVAAEVGVAPLEHGAHAAAGDLAQGAGTAGRPEHVGHLGRRAAGRSGRLARPSRCRGAGRGGPGRRWRRASPGRPRGPSSRVRSGRSRPGRGRDRLRPGSVEPHADQAAGAEPAGAFGRRHIAAAVGLGHRRTLRRGHRGPLHTACKGSAGGRDRGPRIYRGQDARAANRPRISSSTAPGRGRRASRRSPRAAPRRSGRGAGGRRPGRRPSVSPNVGGDLGVGRRRPGRPHDGRRSRSNSAARPVAA